MRLLDRVVLWSYIKSYFICLVSLLSLYVVIDLFTNLDDFAQEDGRLTSFLRHVGSYYGYKVSQIFDRLCEAIVLLAAVFTVALMQRNNELLPFLSAGVSTRRVMQPVFVGAALFLGLGIANQEMLIPRIADALMAQRDDPEGEKKTEVQGTFDTNGVHIEGMQAKRKDSLIEYFYCTIPEHLGNGVIHLTSEKAFYVPRGEEHFSGGWRLTKTVPPILEDWHRTDVLEPLPEPGTYFLFTKEADFEAVTRNLMWVNFASTPRVAQLLSRSDAERAAPLAVAFHMRMTRPVLGFLMVVLGLALILRDQSVNVFISAGLCLVMCGLFYGVIFACKQLGDNDIVSPALAAWLPVIFFGPPAIALYDCIHT